MQSDAAILGCFQEDLRAALAVGGEGKEMDEFAQARLFGPVSVPARTSMAECGCLRHDIHGRRHERRAGPQQRQPEIDVIQQLEIRRLA